MQLRARRTHSRSAHAGKPGSNSKSMKPLETNPDLERQRTDAAAEAGRVRHEVQRSFRGREGSARRGIPGRSKRVDLGGRHAAGVQRTERLQPGVPQLDGRDAGQVAAVAKVGEPPCRGVRTIRGDGMRRPTNPLVGRRPTGQVDAPDIALAPLRGDPRVALHHWCVRPRSSCGQLAPRGAANDDKPARFRRSPRSRACRLERLELESTRRIPSARP